MVPLMSWFIQVLPILNNNLFQLVISGEVLLTTEAELVHAVGYSCVCMCSSLHSTWAVMKDFAVLKTKLLIAAGAHEKQKCVLGNRAKSKAMLKYICD